LSKEVAVDKTKLAINSRREKSAGDFAKYTLFSTTIFAHHKSANRAVEAMKKYSLLNSKYSFVVGRKKIGVRKDTKVTSPNIKLLILFRTGFLFTPLTFTFHNDFVKRVISL